MLSNSRSMPMTFQTLKQTRHAFPSGSCTACKPFSSQKCCLGLVVFHGRQPKNLSVGCACDGARINED
eukprot:7817179-Pyramimonas_sp.AAC.1